MSRFDAEFYSRYRPYYPTALFDPLKEALATTGRVKPYAIADIGCGTGHSTASLLASGIQAHLTGVDPDPAMLAKAREICPQASYRVGSAEHTGLPDAVFNAITVGSAFHWMNASQAREEFLRILHPGGLILIYEYQFPKALALPELNEWIRREFNLRWKAPGQKPRGNFAEVTACFRTDPAFELLNEEKVPMVLPLNDREMTGLILSQSRVLHYENQLTSEEVLAFRAQVLGQMARFMGEQRVKFDFSLQGSLFGVK
ncbi:class I SAM-dependent methyltransferase [Bdellovibrionota bacterium FG-1]